MALFGADQGYCLAFLAGAAGPADAVDVVFGGVWQFEVDHRGQVFDVEAAGCDVGGDQHADLAALEILEGLGTSLLALVAVNGVGGNFVAFKEVGQPAAGELGVHEDQHLVGLFLMADQVGQQVALEAAGNRVDDVADRLADHVAAGHFDQLRVFQHLVGELLDLVREGGREQQALAVGRQEGEDAADIRDEAHVEHAVGFVEDQEFNLAEGDGFLLYMVQQASRSGYHDLDAAAQFLDLRVHVDTAVDAGAAQGEVLGVHLDRLEHLHRQLARRREDQRTYRVAGRAGRTAGVTGQTVEQRQCEAGGLAGTGLGAAHDVVPGEDDGNGLALDRRGFGVAGFGDGLQDFRDEPEFGKRHGYGHDRGAAGLVHCTI